MLWHGRHVENIDMKGLGLDLLPGMFGPKDCVVTLEIRGDGRYRQWMHFQGMMPKQLTGAGSWTGAASAGAGLCRNAFAIG